MFLPERCFSSPVTESAKQHGLRWYAVYTRARHEKQVAGHLRGRGLDCFLPLEESVHRWNDRSAVVSVPLFPGYVFTRVQRCERIEVLTVPGVVHLVGSRNGPEPIPDEEIESVRSCVQRGLPLNVHDYLPAGSAVLVKAGPLTGLRGFLVRWAHGTRLVLSINLIQSSVAVEVDAADVIPIGTRPPRTAQAGA